MVSFGIFLILCVVIIVLVVCLGLKIGKDDDTAIMMGSVAIVLIVIVLSVCSINFVLEKEELSSTDEIEKLELISLSNQQSNEANGQVGGNILFVYGQVQTSKEIFYRVVMGDNTNGFMLKDLPTDDVLLFLEKENATPFVEVDKSIIVYVQDENWLFGGLIHVENEPKTKVEINKYRMHIPKNAVKEIIEVDTSK